MDTEGWLARTCCTCIMVSYELILIISIQEHIFLLLEVAEESFEGDGLFLDCLFR